uniref:Uncharacterized protein n=1 Tax=Trichogramma kaykai TaxID=54128 RepID=A0ABD2W7D4_9HYME
MRALDDLLNIPLGNFINFNQFVHSTSYSVYLVPACRGCCKHHVYFRWQDQKKENQKRYVSSFDVLHMYFSCSCKTEVYVSKNDRFSNIGRIPIVRPSRVLLFSSKSSRQSCHAENRRQKTSKKKKLNKAESKSSEH